MGSRRTSGGYNHLKFNKHTREKGKKTDKYGVWNVKFNEWIGTIYWRGGWRQYVFRACPDVDMSRSCMKEVSDFIDSLMENRK